MKVKGPLIFISILLSFSLFSFRDPPKVKIAVIIRNPDFYNGQKVEIDGEVMEVDVSKEGITCFLKDITDEVIRVALPDKVLKLYGIYKVRGMIQTDSIHNKIILHSLSWEEIEGSKTVSEKDDKNKGGKNYIFLYLVE